MSVKLRLQRLEDSQKATADAVSSGATPEQARQWIDDMIKSIYQGTPKPLFPESDMTDSSEQRKANATAKAWLEEQVISEQKRRSEHEQYKKPIA
jgi:hypothetical protein